MKDTAVVDVSRYIKHKKYGKFINISKRYKAHDPSNTKKEGDKATIQGCAPISKDKRFRIVS
jgi:small subunit ribosomal protein S17